MGALLRAAATPKPAPPRVVQRNTISTPDPGETVYNQTSTSDSSGGTSSTVAPGTAGAKSYGAGGRVTYDMTRGERQVDVTVRIQFVDQKRVTSQFLPDGTTPNPAFDPTASSSTASEIPASDPRRTFAQDMATKVEAKWANKAAFSSRLKPSMLPPRWGGNDPTKEIKLPVVFHAVPVFGLTERYHKRVRLFGAGTTANNLQGHPSTPATTTRPRTTASIPTATRRSTRTSTAT